MQLFMRRLAYAESFDGAMSGTFKEGYHGGTSLAAIFILTHLVYRGISHTLHEIRPLMTFWKESH